MSRFDYVKYDDKASEMQAQCKDSVMEVEMLISLISCPRSKDKAMDALEETYMWIGKGIRNDQIARGGSAVDVPERSKE